jgi:hypothetical protein
MAAVKAAASSNATAAETTSPSARGGRAAATSGSCAGYGISWYRGEGSPVATVIARSGPPGGRIPTLPSSQRPAGWSTGPVAPPLRRGGQRSSSATQKNAAACLGVTARLSPSTTTLAAPGARPPRWFGVGIGLAAALPCGDPCPPAAAPHGPADLLADRRIAARPLQPQGRSVPPYGPVLPSRWDALRAPLTPPRPGWARTTPPHQQESR